MSRFNQAPPFTDKESRSPEDCLRLISFVVNSVSDFVGLLVNLCLIFHIFRKQKTRHVQRPVQSLIANLAVLSILEMVFRYTNTGDQTHLINVPSELCSLVSYLRSVFHTGFLVNISVIIYERLKSFQTIDTSNTRQVRTYLLIFLVWSGSAIFSMPTALMKTSTENQIVEPSETANANIPDLEKVMQKKCKSVHLFGIWELTIVYESLRLFVLHVGVGVLMLYTVLEIRSKLRYLTANSSIPKERLDKKANTIRLLLFYLLSFVFVALPFGVIIFYRRVGSRLIQTTSSITRFFDAFEIVLSPALMFYFYMSPFLSYLLLEGYAISRYDIVFCGPCLRRTSHNAIESNVNKPRDTSLIATCGHSTETNKYTQQVEQQEFIPQQRKKKKTLEIRVTDTDGNMETLV